MRQYSKKASLNLSINAIVIVVLAFVMLGLGLTLTRSVIGQAQETAEDVLDQTRDQILDQLREGDKKIAFPGKEVTVGTTESAIIAFGVKNTGDTDLSYVITLDLLGGPDETLSYPVEKTSGQKQGDFFWSEQVKTLSPGESEVIGIQYRSPGQKGSYLYSVTLREGTDTGPAYTSTDFFVTVQ